MVDVTNTGLPSHNRSSYQQYPYLTGDEFAEACHLLDRRYYRATLGPLRKQWRLTVHTALDVSFPAYSDLVTFLQITRPLEADSPTDNELASQMGAFRLGGDSEGDADDALTEADEMMVETEDLDKEVILRQSSRPRFLDAHGHVTYEIHLHPTYRAPCLWFSLHNLPAGESALDIDTVFRRLVPDQFKDALRGPNGIGGISAGHHPITGVPSFFVHPCMLGDAMVGFDCAKEDYLMVWLGLVGGPVGLWIPREIAMTEDGESYPGPHKTP
ncbi:hypothetical protein DL767_002641 [Monosporascus sp. MG133]|nr:hypothetical protein DL767_002641 [Monosporascus sp. MG133]